MLRFILRSDVVSERADSTIGTECPSSLEIGVLLRIRRHLGDYSAGSIM